MNVPVITALAGVGFLALAAVLAFREHLWLKSAHITEGTVVELITSRSSKGKTSYTPRVSYTTPDGSQREFTRGYSSSPPDFVQGERVAVAYEPLTLDARILTFGQRFGFAVILGAVGLALAGAGGGFLAGRKIVPAVYLKGSAAEGPSPLP